MISVVATAEGAGVPWVYLDDHFDEHPKVLEAREIHRDAPWLFVAGLCYCRRAATDGLIPGPQVGRLITHFSKKAAGALVTVALWDELGTGAMTVHDYGEWNRTNEERSASARNAAQVRWGKRPR